MSSIPVGTAGRTGRSTSLSLGFASSSTARIRAASFSASSFNLSSVSDIFFLRASNSQCKTLVQVEHHCGGKIATILIDSSVRQLEQVVVRDQAKRLPKVREGVVQELD